MLLKGKQPPVLLFSLSQVFVHQRNIHADGFRSLAEGEPLEFQIKEDSRSGKVQPRTTHPPLARSFALQALPAAGTDTDALTP